MYTLNKNGQILIGVLIVALLVIVAYGLFNTPDQRSVGERISDAASRLDDGVDDAARELEPRTPAERIGDEIDDATDGSPQ